MSEELLFAGSSDLLAASLVHLLQSAQLAPSHPIHHSMRCIACFYPISQPLPLLLFHFYLKAPPFLPRPSLLFSSTRRLSWLLRSGTRQGQEPVPAELARITPRLGRIDSGARNRALFVTALLVSIVVVAYIQQDRPSFYRRLSV